LRDNAGLPRDLVLYLARHECGTKICREKGIEYARRLLGHTNVTTTQRYMPRKKRSWQTRRICLIGSAFNVHSAHGAKEPASWQ
jgi:integrase